MANEMDLLFFVLSLAFFVALARGGKLCDFDKRFEHVRPTCSRWSKESETPTSNSVTDTKEDMMVSNTTTDGTSEETTVHVDCFEVYGNKTIQIMNGSSTVNANCTKMVTCINGEIHNLEEYRCSSNAVCEIRNGTRKCYCVSGFLGDGEMCTYVTTDTDCADIFNAGYTINGIYAIKPSNWNGPPFNVYCEMSNVEGWTVFQRRVNGTVDFYRNWTSYKHGFGDLNDEFWLGNDKLYYLTNQGNYILRIDLVNSFEEPYFAEYELFSVNDESDNFRLSALGDYNGTAGYDALRDHLNYPFSTFDRDNDASGGNCAELNHGGWWYNNCFACDLNGELIIWDEEFGNIRSIQMKIRPKI